MKLFQGKIHLIILLLISMVTVLLIRLWTFHLVTERPYSDASAEMVTTRETTRKDQQVFEIPTLPAIRLRGSLIGGEQPSQALITFGNDPPRWVYEGDLLEHGLVVEKIEHRHVLLRQNMAYYEIFLSQSNHGSF